MENNPLAGVLGLLMMLQLGVVLLVLLGGLYALYCLSRAASGLDRLASAVENWVTQTAKFQAQQAAQSTPLPGQNLAPAVPAPPTPPEPPMPPANSDWMRPIELPGNVSASNATPDAAPNAPQVVTAKPPHIPPVSPPFGNEFGSEDEVKRD
jgi:hypothetical protein